MREKRREAFVGGLSASLLTGAAVFALGAVGVLLLAPKPEGTLGKPARMVVARDILRLPAGKVVPEVSRGKEKRLERTLIL